MIPVACAPEPDWFERVRRPGLDALAELTGAPRSRARRGPKRRQTYATRQDIPPDKLPDTWTVAIDDPDGLRDRYRGLCAYLALYLEPGTGAATVDHFVPKSIDRELAYEWSNYRLCTARVNGHRGDRVLPLDPFTLRPGLFALELAGFQVVAGPAAGPDDERAIEQTICVLGLNARPCWRAREAYVDDYRTGPPHGIALARLEARAPFVAAELRRQGELVRGDR